MATSAPGLHTVKPQLLDSARPGLRDVSLDNLDDDPTEYPDSEVMCREPVENEICLQLQQVLRRYQAERGVICYIGSDNFLYWIKGDIRACLSPDIYILPGIPQSTRPARYVGAKDEQCWKLWIHHVVPNFALEVKARRNPRKDELQSPARHDALGTKELIVFDPFFKRRRAHRKRFVVYRRDANGRLVIVHETNEDRAYSRELDAFVVAQFEGDDTLLRLGLGPNGEKLLPFDSELVDLETRKRQEETRLRQEETRLRQEETRLRQEETRRATEALQRAEHEAHLRQQEAQRAAEALQRADDAIRRAAELEAEVRRLRAASEARSKRASKKQ